ncbi:MAG: hypothetical protein A3J10_03635 [Candidatus Sungbacteria bacterium RIFCSPLOWO2_02_FULL_54_10]|uniref:Uncharacterized protein n=2 Tax=Candidatus Sungiibacteriota TaxID=1817917 RepID=A0A1G2L4E9_9BACT|nr:MAG: hypothetical protein A2679_02115 [Candidatus Sungbacteria bacterium RIFCSPHIGHO2_01_FULL_54_26]OHA02683.1 MAG: hypothetical protein A3C92_02575 [Candidatus Sungbacteria bacterium RIFCSPHIGHO2_02_FULL_53_17]OHA06535.1 MAG: hypothetical protein A3B34_01310 [Candidatus Sungbacteria bacterium RIFCSPLOWO2_01_FULL_54_21]OHA11913.1 MAG: hypothetical protein A3J10_03635 [Candidatus Sungbacteria bacterium RIFCSPLOWO2_02_FULL_54_10]HXK38901.1 hypothetical protein [Candidatus Paceibacterota bacter
MNRNTFFSLALVVLLGVIGYTWYGYLETPVPGADTERASFSKILTEVRLLKTLDLDTSLFQDRFFRDLEEPQEIPQPDVTPGRENPFAPFK